MGEGRVTETIRARLKRRKRRSLAAAGIGFAVMAIAAVLGYLFAEGGSQYRLAVLAVAVLGLVILSGSLLYLDRTKCPNCLGRPGPVLYTRSTNFCPQCGVSLDIPAR